MKKLLLTLALFTSPYLCAGPMLGALAGMTTAAIGHGLLWVSKAGEPAAVTTGIGVGAVAGPVARVATENGIRMMHVADQTVGTALLSKTINNVALCVFSIGTFLPTP